MRTIWSCYIKPYYLRMAGGFAVKFTGTLMDLFLPWALAYMIDTIIPANGRRDILLWGVLMAVCSVMAAVFNILANRMASRVASEAVFLLRKDLFSKTMYLPGWQVDELTRPSLISRLTTDTYNIQQMLGRIQRIGVRAPILLLGGIVMTMALDRVLSGILLATLPPLALVVILVSKKSVPLFSRLQESTDHLIRLVREDIGGIRVIKALSREEDERRRFDRINREVVERERTATLVTAITNPSMTILLNLGLAAVIFAGAVRVGRGVSEVGKILAFMTYFTIILNALLSISRVFVTISKAAASADRIVQVLKAEPEKAGKRAKGGKSQESAEGETKNGKSRKKPPHIEFDQVCFSYNKTRDNLTDICFSLARGEVLGIIGATGSGKSTIASLLMRFYDVDKGAIRVSGHDIRDMDLQDLRGRFGSVFQNDIIFGNTIFENIDMGRGLKREQVQQAVNLAEAKGFVREKGGLEKRLDIGGANLSGGQKQRIFIARALAGQPEILILDDSSSALDYKTDKMIRERLHEHFADSTCVIIAQRIIAIQNNAAPT